MRPRKQHHLKNNATKSKWTRLHVDHLAYIKIDHEDNHVPYVPIDIPEDVKVLIINNPKWTPTQVYIYICQVNMLTMLQSFGTRSSKFIQSLRLRRKQSFRYGQK